MKKLRIRSTSNLLLELDFEHKKAGDPYLSGTDPLVIIQAARAAADLPLIRSVFELAGAAVPGAA